MPWFPASEMMSLVDGAPRFDLGESVGPDCRLADLFDLSDAAQFADMPLAYGTAAGEPRLRTAIAEAHGVHADDVVTTIGGIHALFLLAFILCGADDEAVTTAPLFPLARNALGIGGAAVRTLPLRFDRGYQLDVAELRAQLSPRTKLVSLATPQNPSGVSIGRETLRDVLTAMSETCPDAYLLVDETYREAVYGDDAVVASAACLSPKVVVVASLSKCHGAPGLRLGWAITRDKVLREQLVRGKFSTVVSCSPVCEALALKVFERRDSILSERRTRLAAGLTATATWVQDHSALVDWVRPDAGALCCVRLRPTVFDESTVARFYDALTPAGARVANGRWFGDEERVFRLGFGLLPAQELRGALDVLTTVLKQVAGTTAG